MIKSILVALDPDQDTQVATQYAAELAARFGAGVTGCAVIDKQRIAAEIGPGGAVGATYYIEQSRRRMIDEARETAYALTGAFDAALEEAHVPHEKRVEEGAPVRRVVDALKYNDLLIIGRTPHFFYNRPERKTNTLARIVKHGVAPALVVGEAARPVRRVLVAYDGSDAAARTMQRFAQLQPFGAGLEIELVHVRTADNRRERHDSALRLRLAGQYLKAHGFERVAEASMQGNTPSAVLLEQAERIDADLIVAGAHSVSAVRRMAFGSTTYALLETCTIPLFVFH